MKLDININDDHKYIVIHFYRTGNLLSIQGFHQKLNATLSEVKHSHLNTFER